MSREVIISLNAKNKICAHLQKCLENGSFFFDGEDGTVYANGEKTQRFIDRIGIDRALEILEEIISPSYFSKKTEPTNWRETKAVEFKDWDRDLMVKYDLDDRLYLKVFNYDTSIPIFDFHD